MLTNTSDHCSAFLVGVYLCIECVHEYVVYGLNYEVPDYARSAEVLSTPLSTHTFSPPLFLSRFVHLTSNKGHFLFSNPVVCSVCGLRFCLCVWVFPCWVYMCKYAFENSDCESHQWRHRFKFKKAGWFSCKINVFSLRMTYVCDSVLIMVDEMTPL